jgi:hypothetical protein
MKRENWAGSKSVIYQPRIPRESSPQIKGRVVFVINVLLQRLFLTHLGRGLRAHPSLTSILLEPA